MAVAGSINFTVTGGQTAITGIAANSSGTVATQIAETINAAVSNQLFSISIVRANLQSIFLVASGALTIKTNSSGSPADTFTFAANMPLVWVLGMPFPTSAGSPEPTPFSADVTAMYLSNAGAAPVTLQGVIVLNS